MVPMPGDPALSAMWRTRLVALVLATAAILAGMWHARPPQHVTIEVGPVGGSFYQIAQTYQKFFAARGIELELRPKANSLEILGDLKDADSGIDIGFESQDVSAYKEAPVFTVGHIQLQPLFVFASADLGRRIALTDLRGRKIVMPPSTSATSDAAVRMLQLYDITAENTSFTFMQLADAAKALRAGQFDAGAFMLAPENQVVRDLADYSGLRLVPVPEAKAIANHLPFLRPTTLPRGIYDIADGVPPTDVPMLAGTVDVVVRKGLHPVVVYTLLEAMADAHRGATFISNAGAYPTISGAELPIQELAQEYYRSGMPWVYRNLPAWPASFVDRYLLVALSIFVLCEIYRIATYFGEISLFLLLLRSGRTHRERGEPVRNRKFWEMRS
jgi:TRAP-type uncharacterized transport system substrate-binding protein